MATTWDENETYKVDLNDDSRKNIIVLVCCLHYWCWYSYWAIW